MKTGLVLEGGGMRGIYSAGVLDVFLEKNIEFDAVIGVSAGAIHGVSFVSKQHGRSIRYFKKHCTDRRFMSAYSLLTTGNIVGEKLCFHEIPDSLDPFDHEAFEASPTKFYAVCTNLETGEAEYIHCPNVRNEMLEYVRASSAIPYLSRLVKINGKKYLDGGMAASIPLLASKRMGYEKNVVVLTREAGYTRSSDNVPALNWRYRKYPAFLKVMQARPAIYAQEQADIEAEVREGNAFAIRPSVPPLVGRLERDADKLQALYDLGREDALRAMPALNRFLLSSKERPGEKP